MGEESADHSEPPVKDSEMPKAPSSQQPDPFDVWSLKWLPWITYGAIILVIPVGIVALKFNTSLAVTSCVVISIVFVAVLSWIVAVLWPCPYCGSPFQYEVSSVGFEFRGIVVPGRTRCANCDRSIERADLGAERDVGPSAGV